MAIAKLHLVCPKCFQVNDRVESIVDEVRECTECGKLSSVADFSISSDSDEYQIDMYFPCAYHRSDGENWSLKIRPKHKTLIVIYVILALLPTLLALWLIVGLRLYFFSFLLLVLGGYYIWAIMVRFLGKVEISLDDKIFCVFRGVGSVGRKTYFSWPNVTQIRQHESASEFWFLRVFSRYGKNNKEESKDIYLDITKEQFNYIENFLYHKLDIRDKKIAHINSGPDTEELKLQ